MYRSMTLLYMYYLDISFILYPIESIDNRKERLEHAMGRAIKSPSAEHSSTHSDRDLLQDYFDAIADLPGLDRDRQIPMLKRMEDDELPEPFDQRARRRCFREIFSTLATQDQYILDARFGPGGNSPRTLVDVGQELGVSRERGHQIERKALAHL